jgi:hypothetical protein
VNKERMKWKNKELNSIFQINNKFNNQIQIARIILFKKLFKIKEIILLIKVCFIFIYNLYIFFIIFYILKFNRYRLKPIKTKKIKVIRR